MRRFIAFHILLCLLLAGGSAAAQKVVVDWDSTYGGSQDDELSNIYINSANEIMLLGWSESGVSGEKSTDANGKDFWLVKTDAGGGLLWDARFGGAEDDLPFGIAPDPAGGYYLFGETSSDQINFERQAPAKGTWSAAGWTVRANENGSFAWDSVFCGGGGSSSKGSAMIPTSDGGFLCAIDSRQNAGFNKSDDAFSGGDAWIVKFDAGWNVEWDVTLGGDKLDNGWNGNLLETPDGSFIVGVRSESGATGNKTEPGQGERDIWFLKLSAAGAVEWQRVYGGSGAELLGEIALAADGNVVIGASSASDAHAGKSEDKIGGFTDFWALKISPVDGSVIWENTIGTTGTEICEALLAFPNGNVLIGGGCGGGANGDKTEASNGSNDYWIVMLDPNGQILWDKAFGGSGYEELNEMALAPDGNIVLAGYSSSGASGDKSGPSRGGKDYWVIKTKPEQPLALPGAQLKAELTGPRSARLSWSRATLENGGAYAVLRSRDGKTWTTRTETEAGSERYAYLDGLDAPGYYYYKVRYAAPQIGEEESRVAEVYAPLFGSRKPALSPNPARDRTRLRLGAFAGTATELALYDAQGRAARVFEAAEDGAEVELPLNGLAPGVYLLRVGGSEGAEWLKLAIK